MSGEKHVKVIFNGEDKGQIKLPRPDIVDVKGVICKRFGVQSDVSIVARIVPEGARQEEYVISSSADLQDLWEDLTELHITDKRTDSGEITLTEGLRVIFNNDREDVKRITFTRNDIEDIKKVICERFFAEKVSLLAIIKGDNDKYSISTNDDVKEMWKSIVELHVTGKKKRLDIDMIVAINRERHSIDVIPNPSTDVVLKARQELGIIDDLVQIDKTFRRMGAIANICYFAAVATGNQDLQLGTKNLGFSAIEICRAADNMFESYVNTSTTVNETFHTAIIYLLENDYDRALRMISSLEGATQECTDKTKTLIAKIDKVSESKILSDETRRMIMEEREKAELLEKEQEKKRLELKHVQSEIRELGTKPGAVKPFLHVLVSNFFRAANVVVGAVTSSEPKFLLATGKGLLGYAAEKEEDEEKKKDETRMREEKKRKNKQDAEKQLSRDLRDLQKDIEEAEKNDRCLHILGGELFKMKLDLKTMKSFFEDFLLFCQAIKMAENQLNANVGPCQTAKGGEVAKVNCSELFEAPGFKQQLVNYMAKWVAIKEVCLECRGTLKKTELQLHDHIEKNPTKEEARRDINSMVDDMRENL
ncbi:uncharacterized protein LOC135491696 [Lineus longissimus]|uniref:uncharacterized protein LOC135491696 n=1 Tax=Lineus longissimus TaxID=88925 RepID=UPI00315C8FC5